MLLNWLSRLRRNKKEKIPLYIAPIEETSGPKTTHSELVAMLKTINVDDILNNPVTQIAVVPLYCASIDILMQEVLVSSRNRSLVGVTLSHFFKESNLNPHLAMERLAGLFTTEPSSNFARFDIITLIKEMQSLAKV